MSTEPKAKHVPPHRKSGQEPKALGAAVAVGHKVTSKATEPPQQQQQQQQLGRAVAAPAVVGTDADGAVPSSVTSSAASSSGVAPAVATFIKGELVFSDDAIVGRGAVGWATIAVLIYRLLE